MDGELLPSHYFGNTRYIVRLVLLVVGSILPLAIVAGLTTYQLSAAYDEAASERLLRLEASGIQRIRWSCLFLRRIVSPQRMAAR